MDSVREILDVAASVLYDYAPDDPDRGPEDPEHHTRIERMARWIALNLAADVHDYHEGEVSKISAGGTPLTAYQYRDHLSVKVRDGVLPSPLSIDNARQLATALFMCVERAEQD